MGSDISSEINRLVSIIRESNPDLVSSTRIQRAWSNTVDSTVLDHTDGIFVIPDTDATEIIIYVDSSIWAADLNMQGELLRLKLNIALNEILEQEGELPALPQDTEALTMFDLASREHIRKMRFVTSREGYVKKGNRVSSSVSDDQEKVNIEPVELDVAELRKLEEAAEAIDDPKLKEAILSAARADLEWKKGIESSKRPQI